VAHDSPLLTPETNPAPFLHLVPLLPQLKDAFAFGGAEFVAKLVMYVAYERLWLHL
jgi:hypothetical protein